VLYIFFSHNNSSLSTPAIFDLKWSYQKINNNGYLGMADAIGNVTVYKLVNKGTNVIKKKEKKF